MVVCIAVVEKGWGQSSDTVWNMACSGKMDLKSLKWRKCILSNVSLKSVAKTYIIL